MKKSFLISLCSLLLFASCEKNKVTSLVLSEREKVMTMGERGQLEVTIYPLTAVRDAKIVWESSNESVVTVSSNGELQALTPGEAIVGAVCGDIYAECKITVLAVKAHFDFHSAILYYMGDRYKRGTNNVLLMLLHDGLTHDGNGGMSGDGFFLNMSLNQPLSDTLLRASTYKADTTARIDSYFVGDVTAWYSPGSYLGQMTSGAVGAIFIKEGECVVAQSDGNYTITVALEGKSGEVISGKFSGKITAFDASDSAIEERNLNITQVRVDGVEEKESVKQLQLTAKGNGDSLRLCMNVPLSAGAGVIPSGKYQVASDFSPFSLEQGRVLDGGEEAGSFLLGTEHNAITSGEIEVAQNGANYTFTFALRYENTRITGSYSGIVKF